MQTDPKIKRMFFYSESVLSGIFESQVLQYLLYLKSNGCEVTLVCFGSLNFLLNDRKNILDKLNKISQCGLHYLYFPSFSPFNAVGKGLSCFYAFCFVCYCFVENQPLIIQARGIWSAKIGYLIKRFFKNTKLIFDMRGDELSEYEYNFRFNVKNHQNLKYIEQLQKSSVCRSDVCLFVSHALKQLASSIGEIRDHYIIPSTGLSQYFFYDKNIREKRRKELNVSGKFVVGYSGSIASWQRVDKVIEVFEMVRSINHNAVLVVFTKEIEEFKKQFNRYTDSEVVLRSLKNNELGEYIQCFDMGVLLRDKLILNKVASPTKFAEYLLCGVPSLVSAGIGDLEQIISEQNAGICIQDIDDQSGLQNGVKRFLNKKFDREEIAKYGKSDWCREAYLDVYKKIFEVK